MSAPSPLHARLREATATLHGQLDGSLALARLPLTADVCRRHLRACAGYYAPLEARLFALAETVPSLQQLDLPDRRKLPLLQADLATLDASEPVVPCVDLPKIESADDCWGLFYVFEGATLGGTVLQARIARHAPQLPSLRFFSGYGSATAARWRTFVQALDAAHRAAAIDEARVVKSARAAFESLLLWFRQQGCTTAA